MDIKLTQKNSVLKTAGKFVSEDINLTVDESLVGGGSSAEPPYTSIIKNSGSDYFGCYIPDENGILVDRRIESGETITIKHYGLFTWYRGGNWSFSWGGTTYAPDTYGTYYCIQTGSTENVYTLSVSPRAGSGGAS